MTYRRPTRFIRTTPLLALPLVLLTAAPAHALQIDATANWSYNGVAAGSDIDGPASSGSVDILNWNSDPTNSANSVFYHTYGDDTGNFGSRTSGTGNFDITGNYSFSETYVASGGAATFDFHIVPGELALYNSALLSAADQLIASYVLDIRLNGTTIWRSSATLDQTGTTINLTQSDTILGTYTAGSDQYSWMDYLGSLALGTFSAGETFTIEYDLTTTAFGNLTCDGSTTTGNTGGVKPNDPTNPDTGGSAGNVSPCAGAIARIGDPFGVSDPNNIYPDSSFKVIGASSAVPEPNTVALLSLGLAGMVIGRRRKA